MKLYRIGKVSNTHGLKGEIKVYSYTDYIERFEEIEYVYIDNEKYFIENVRYAKQMPLLKFKKLNNINDIEHLKGKEIFIDSNNLRDLDEDEYMISDLIGIGIYLENGDFVGFISDVLTYSANDVYIVKNEIFSKEYLIPVIKDVVKEIDLKNKKIIIENMKGLLD